MAFSKEVESAVKKYSTQFDVEADLVRAVIQQESGGNPQAKGDYDDIGIPHSFGLMQLYDKGAGAGYSTAYLLNIDNNVRLGTQYLKACINAFPGDLKTAVSAYNQGIGGARDRGWTYNSSYVNSVMAIYYSLTGVTPEEEEEEEERERAKGKVVTPEVRKGLEGSLQETLEGITPTEEETKDHWKRTLDKIAVGCSLYFVIFVIIVGVIILIVMRL